MDVFGNPFPKSLKPSAAVTLMMLEILLTLILGVLLAKHPKRRRRNMGAYLKGNVDEVLALGTLAARTLIGAGFDESMIESGRISSLVATWSLNGVTAGTNDGPILVGISHSDYTDSEVEAVIENTGSWDRGNKIQQEVAKRLVRIIGTFRIETSDIGQQTYVLNDGRPIKTKLNWALMTGDSLSVWAYNLGSSAFATTDPQVHVEGHANLWMK